MTIVFTLVAFLSLQGPARLPAPQAQGVVSGQILSVAGGPAAGVRVGAMDVGSQTSVNAPIIDTQTATSEEPTLVSVAVTGADGRYQLEGLAPGRYTIFAGPLLVPTYYPGGTTLSKASVVTVAAGSTVANVNFSLAPATEGFKVSGRIVWHDRNLEQNKVDRNVRENLRRTEVVLVEMDGSAIAGSTVLAADDSFEFAHVHPGTYVLMAQIRQAHKGIQPVIVTVSDKNVAGVEVVVPRIIEVHGVAMAEDGQALSSLSMSFASMSEAGGAVDAEIDADGTFAAQVPEGEYRLLAQMVPAGYYFKSLTAGSMDLLREPLKLTVQDSRIRIVAVLARGTPVTVSGRIRAPAGSALPTSVELTGMALHRETRTAIRPDGTFTVCCVMPGTYAAGLSLDSGLRISAAPFVIPEKDVAEIEIAAPSLREIVGRVSVTGNGPLATGNMLAFSRGPVLDLKSVIGRRALFGLGGTNFMRFRGGEFAQSMSQQDDLHFIPLPPVGEFRLTLPEGQYQVAVINQRELAGRGPATESLNNVRDMTYGGANLLNEPMKVARSDSAELLVTLTPNPRIARFKVAGRVLGLAPDTQRVARVTLDGDNIAQLEVPVAADGSFEFTQIPRGEYAANVTPANALTPHREVLVLDRDVSGIAIRIPVVREIKGRITVEGNGPPIGFALMLEGDNGPMTLTANPRPDGTFQITAPEGTFRLIRVERLPSGYGIKSLKYGQTDLLFNPLVVTSALSDLSVTLEVNEAAPFVKVRGRVSGVNVGQVTRITLTGMSAPATFETAVADGVFDFPKVSAGVYLVSLTRNGQSVVAEPPLIAVASSSRTGVTFEAPATAQPVAATDSLRAARATANEAAAVANLRTVNTAQVTFLSTSGGEFGDITELIAAGLLDSRFEASISGYFYAISVAEGEYVAAAAPVNAQAGSHGFFTTPDGVIRFAMPEGLTPPGKAGEPVQ